MQGLRKARKMFLKLSLNLACLVWKLLGRLVGVFCTLPDAHNSRIMRRINFYQSEGMPEWVIESLGVMGWELVAARKFFRRRRRRRPPKVSV